MNLKKENANQDKKVRKQKGKLNKLTNKFILMKKKNNCLILGIDDSGRGPVIGPMILAGCLIDEQAEKEFKRLGVKDSKLLTKNRRKILAEVIEKQAIAFEITKTDPNEIDGRNHVGLNLNKIEAIKSAEIINKINKGLDKIKVIIDCPSPNTIRWRNYLLGYIDNIKNLKVLCEHKADVNHIACSAASVLAKVTRDAEVEKIKERIGKNFGSGYPSDPITQKFIENHYSNHKKDGIFRETWQTVKNHKAKKEQKKLGEF